VGKSRAGKPEEGGCNQPAAAHSIREGPPQQRENSKYSFSPKIGCGREENMKV